MSRKSEMDSTRTLTLTDFLLARIAEDEDAVREVTERDPILPGDRAEWFADMDDLRVAVSPKRGLAECEAKRRIVEEHENGSDFPTSTDPDGFDYCGTCHDYERHDAAGWPCDTIRHLATPYADHPCYRKEWAV